MATSIVSNIKKNVQAAKDGYANTFKSGGLFNPDGTFASSIATPASVYGPSTPNVPNQSYGMPTPPNQSYGQPTAPRPVVNQSVGSPVASAPSPVPVVAASVPPAPAFDPNAFQSNDPAVQAKIAAMQAQAATPAVPPATTPADLYGGAYDVPTDDPAASAADQAYLDILKGQMAEPSQADIQRQTMTRFQAEIDALNKLYAEKKSEAAISGSGLLGSSSAIQARRGLIGSDFGAAQTGVVEKYNQSVQDALDSEKEAKIGAILSQANSDAAAEFEAKTAARKAGAQEYIAYLAGAADKKKEKVTNYVSELLYSGVAEPKDFTELAKQLGVTAQSVTAEYNKQKAAKDKADLEAKPKAVAPVEVNGVLYEKQTDGSYKAVTPAKAEAPEKPFSVSPGASVYDPATGEVVFTAPAAPNSDKPVTMRTASGTDLQWNPETRTWDELSAPTAPTTEKAEKAQGIIDKIDNLLSTTDWKAGVGPISANLPDWLSGKRNTAIANINQIVDSLALENLNLLKGPMSDKDIQFIRNAAAGLNINMDEASFEKKIREIRTKMQDIKNNASSGTNGIPEQDVMDFMAERGVDRATAEASLNAAMQSGTYQPTFNQPLSTGGNGSPVVSKIVNNYEQGQKGGQCGRFVNNVLGIKVGDSYASKLAYTNPSIGTKNNPPKPGDLFVIPYKQTGHTGIVMDITPKNDGTYDVKVADSNYNLNEKVSFHTLNSKNMSFGRV